MIDLIKDTHTPTTLRNHNNNVLNVNEIMSGPEFRRMKRKFYKK